MTGRLIPRSRTNALATWRTGAARDIAGYLALVGGQALAVDVEGAIGFPAKGMRAIVEKHPSVFRVTHERHRGTGKDFMVIVLVHGEPRDLSADVARRLEKPVGISGIDQRQLACLGP